MLLKTMLKKVPHFTTLAGTLATALVLLSVFSLVVASSFQIILNVRSQQAVVAGQQHITALHAAEKVVALIAETVSILEAASVVGRPFEESRVKRELFLQSLLKLHPALKQVALLDSEGQELQKLSRRKAVPAESVANLAGSDLFRQIRQQQSYVGAFSLDADTREPLVTVAVPVLDTFGTFEGGLAADVNIRAMWEVVAALQVGQAGQVYVVDRSGKLLAYKDSERVLANEHLSQLAHVAEFMRQPNGTTPFSIGRTIGVTGTAVVATVVPVGDPDWAVIVELPVWEAYHIVVWSVAFSAGGVLIVALAASVIGVYLARRLVGPLQHVTETASRIAAGELDLPMRVGGRGEIGTLSRSFEDMRDAIRARIADLHDEITERQRVEEALRESNERFQMVVDSLDAVVYVADMETYELLLINQRVRKVLGDVVGQICWQTLQAGQTGPCEFCTNARLLTPEREAVEPLVWEFQSTVDHRWYECRDQAIRWPDGRMVRLEIATDITERKQTETIIRESEDLFRNTFEQVAVGMAISSPEGVWLQLNQRFCDILGYSRDELLAHTYRELTHPDHVAQDVERVRQMVAGVRRSDSWEKRYIRKNGQVIWARLTTSLFRSPDHHPKYFITVIEDITERKQAEEKVRTLNLELETRIRQRTAELETANTELERFAYVVSHDLKAPLRGISRLVEWLVEDYAGAFDAKGREMAGLLVGRVKRMDALIDGILEYSRIGRIVGQPDEIDLNRLLTEVIDLLSPPPTIQIEIVPELPVIVGDSIRILQVFSNLIGNAIKFMDKPHGIIRVDCKDGDGAWRFSVTDNGPGIEPQHYERIFQIFQTLKPRDEMENTGIGLTIVKKIVELYGGKIWVESTVGEGSTFYFTMPQKPESP